MNYRIFPVNLLSFLVFLFTFFWKNRYNRKVSVSTVSVFLLYLFTSVGIPQESE